MNPPLSTPEVLSGLIFLILVTVTIGGAVIATCVEQLVRGVAGLALCFIGVAGIYYYLNSPFIALMQLLIYVGAVCVTIVFAVMLATPIATCKLKKQNSLGGPVSFIGAGVLVWALAKLGLSTEWRMPLAKSNDGTLADVGKSMLTTYSMSFELISVVLLVAIIGALVLARTGRSR